MDRSDLAERMKGYEKRNRYYLQRRMPVILRLDMRAGHSFTKGFKRPFDEIFIKSMQSTAKYLCENIQNCKLSYQQSDEITLLLVDYDKLDTDCFFDYRVDKLCSITASMAAMAFNKFFEKYVDEYRFSKWDGVSKYEDGTWGYIQTLLNAVDKGAMFDARCFNIPKEEVTNLIYWRQLDASRNSIQMVGQANFSHKELQNKSCNDIQDMLMIQKGINWNDLPTCQKRGSCCIKEEYAVNSNDVNSNDEEVEVDYITDVDEPVESVTFKSRWIIDTDIPIFKGEDREYIDRLVFIGEK